MPAAREITVSVVNRVPGLVASRFRSGGRLARTAAPVLERLLPKDRTEVVVKSGPACGLRVLIDAQHEKYYWTGTHERAVQDYFEALLRPGDVVWDVGAHIGFFSLLASRRVGPSGAVIAFEPVGDNRLRLQSNLCLNDVSNVSVRSEAVGALSATAFLHSRGSSSMWTLQEADASAMGSAVPCIALDDVAGDLPAPVLLKVDVEGLELDVLRGAQGVLRRWRPILIVELSDSSAVDDCAEITSGYDVRRIDASHWSFVPRAPQSRDLPSTPVSSST